MQELVDESLCLFHDLASHSRIAKGDSSAALEYQTDTPSTSLNEKTVDIQKISVYEKIDSSPSIQPSFSRDLVQKLYTMRASYYLLLFNVIVILLKFLVKPNDNFVSRLALPPGRFFQRSSMKYLVDDYMGMNVPPSQLHSTDIVIVMYYASWSLKSRALRPVFEQVARQFTGRSDLAFVATNCFTRLGKCRESYKLYSFPIIIAYIGNSQVMYTGELAMDYIIRWILHIRTPMIRLSKRHEILDFFLAHDNAVVAFFPVESVLKKTWRYQQFMLASILMSQYDQTMSSVGFAVLTDHFEALNLLDITAESQIHLHSFNHSSTYPNEHDYNGSAIAAWVHANSKAPEIEWISSESWNLGKTEQLYHILNSGPTVITFTQRDVLNVASSDLNIVKQVVMEYLDCNSPKKGLHVSSARSAALTYKAETYLNHFMFPSIRLYNVLRNLSHPMQDQLHQCCLLSVASLEQICNQCAVPRRGLVNSEMCTNWRFHKHHKSFPLLNFSACRKLAQVKTKDEIMTDCCMWMQNADLIDFLMPERSSCKWPGFGYCPRLNYGHSIRSHNSKEESIYGLSCSTNNSLRFAAVDIRHHDHLLRKLNLSSSTPTMNTSIVIVDAKAETVHLMQSQLSGSTFRSFLRAFHTRSLPPYRVSERMLENTNLGFGKHDTRRFLNKKQSHMNLRPQPIFITRTTSQNFKTDILDGNTSKDVVLLFSGGKWHGPSAAVLYVYQNVLHFFKPFDEFIKFFIIDVSQNELPWQYRMDRLPSLLFFPAGRRSSSALFPRNIPFSVSSVIAFVLSQCQRDLRLRIALTSCSMHCIRRNVADLRHRQNRIRRQLAVVRKVSAEYNFQVITFEKMIIMYGNELRLTQATIELLYSLQVLSKEMIKQETLWLVELYIRLRAFLLSLHPTSFV